MPSDKLSVIVIDDRSMPRAAARAMLGMSNVFRVIGEAASAEEGTSLAESMKPNVVLLDVEMPGVDGEAAARRIRRVLPEAAIVAWTVSDEPSDLLRMVRAGCSGYVLKDVGPAELERALSAAIRGETAVPRRMVSEVIRTAAENAPRVVESLAAGLSQRETEVLIRIAWGRTSKQIARDLNLATSSVNSHTRNLLRKLGVSSRTEAVTLALRHGLLQIDDLEAR